MVTPDLNKLRDQVRTGRAGGPRTIAPPPSDETPPPLPEPPALPQSGWVFAPSLVERIDAWLQAFHTRHREAVAGYSSVIFIIIGAYHAFKASGFWAGLLVFGLIWFGGVAAAMGAFYAIIYALRKAVLHYQPILAVAAFLIFFGLLRAWFVSP